ncbi:MAG: hypothetical protein ACYC8S_02085 [Minisyncoccota bacterium]
MHDDDRDRNEDESEISEEGMGVFDDAYEDDIEEDEDLVAEEEDADPSEDTLDGLGL